MKRVTLSSLGAALLLLVQPAAAQEAADPIADAKARIEAGDTAGAVTLLQKTVGDSGSAGIQLEAGRLLAELNELDLAMDAFKVAATGGDAAEAHARLSLAQELRGMLAEADASAEAALAADPESAWAALAASQAKARAGDGDEALALAQKAVAGEAGVAARTALGRAHEAGGDLAAAEEAYAAALEAAPGDLAAKIGMARVLRRTGRAAEAEPLLVEALAAAPGAVPAYKEAARVKIALGRPMEALGDAATAAVLAPEDPDALALQKEVTVARALSYLSDPNQAGLAIPDLQALIAQDPDSVVAHVGLAQAYISERQLDEAQVALDKALSLDPENPEALYWQGHLRLALRDDFAGAVEPLGKAVAGDPANVKYRTEYGLALKQVQQFPEAIAELERVTESPGYEKADAWMFLGEAQVGAQRYKGAVASLSKAAEIAGEVARIEAMLGWAYFGLKDAENFKKHAGKARDLGYDEATLLQYLKRVEGGEAIK